jgi:hypothetical protein
VATITIAEAHKACGIVFKCFVCGGDIIDGESIRAHKACETCGVCGSTMEVHKIVDKPVVVTCWDCVRRIQLKRKNSCSPVAARARSGRLLWRS